METREASEGIRVHTDPSNRLSSNNNPRPQNKSKEIPTSTLYSGQNEKFRTHCLHCGQHHYYAQRKLSDRRIIVLFAYDLIIDRQIVQLLTSAETATHQIIINPHVTETRKTKNKSPTRLVLLNSVLKHPPIEASQLSLKKREPSSYKQHKLSFQM